MRYSFGCVEGSEVPGGFAVESGALRALDFDHHLNGQPIVGPAAGASHFRRDHDQRNAAVVERLLDVEDDRLAVLCKRLAATLHEGFVAVKGVRYALLKFLDFHLFVLALEGRFMIQFSSG